jgi:signal transduction histidine kinase
MLHEFLTSNRAELIDRCRLKVARRSAPTVTSANLIHGIPLYLELLVRTLQVEQSAEPMKSRKVSGPAGGGTPVLSEMGATAALHGRELLKHGFTVDQVVHHYGDLCQAITDLAIERNAPIEVDEFRTLNRCLDNAIAEAVTEYTYQRDSANTSTEVQALNERLGFVAHELRDFVHTATLAVTAMRTGHVGMSGATGAVLDRCLVGLRTLADRSLVDVRVTAGMPLRHELISLADLIAQVATSASLEANAAGCKFTVSHVEERLGVDVDREMLFSAVGNLVQNAFKFTRRNTEVTLSAYAAADRVLIDVEDHCGGLPPGAVDHMFLPFTQSGGNRSGVGLGLAMCRRSVEANNGILRVRDVPGTGCIFTIDLLRHALP